MATTFSKTHICNLALIKLNENTVTNIEPSPSGSFQDPAARRCNTVYPQAKLQILRSHSWNFAKKQAELTKNTKAPLFGDYTYSYELPPDFVRIFEQNEDRDFYKRVGNNLYTREETSRLWYVHEAPEGLFDALFVEALATLIASKAASPSKGRDEARALLREYKNISLPEAKAADDIENKEIYRRSHGAWLDSRYGSMGIGGTNY